MRHKFSEKPNIFELFTATFKSKCKKLTISGEIEPIEAEFKKIKKEKEEIDLKHKHIVETH
jgi:hypothetical protein